MLNRVYVLIYLGSQWIPCGLLEYQESGRRSSSRFRYGKKYLARTDAISIDPLHLPLEDRSFETLEGFQIFNGIRDAAPDKWGRYLLDKKFARPLSEIEYLAASSDDRVGALAFTESLESAPSLGGARPKSAVIWNKENYLAKFPLSLDSKNEPLIEYATMTLAQKCGLHVPPLHLEKIGGKSVFLIQRFDRQAAGV